MNGVTLQGKVVFITGGARAVGLLQYLDGMMTRDPKVRAAVAVAEAATSAPGRPGSR